MTNIEIRRSLKEHNVKQWELAEALGKHETVMSRMLRHEVDQTTKDHLLSVIESIGSSREVEN